MNQAQYVTERAIVEVVERWIAENPAILASAILRTIAENPGAIRCAFNDQAIPRPHPPAAPAGPSAEEQARLRAAAEADYLRLVQEQKMVPMPR